MTDGGAGQGHCAESSQHRSGVLLTREGQASVLRSGAGAPRLTGCAGVRRGRHRIDRHEIRIGRNSHRNRIPTKRPGRDLRRRWTGESKYALTADTQRPTRKSHVERLRKRPRHRSPRPVKDAHPDTTHSLIPGEPKRRQSGLGLT